MDFLTGDFNYITKIKFIIELRIWNFVEEMQLKIKTEAWLIFSKKLIKILDIFLDTQYNKEVRKRSNPCSP